MRIKAEVYSCGCEMKRAYAHAERGNGWDPVGWMCSCGCGCVGMDEGEWALQDCKACKGGQNEE